MAIMTTRGNGIVVVLGMHRSGTSAMTYALTTMGIDLGTNLLDAQADNERGFWEDADIVQLNEDLLHRAGTTWQGFELKLEERIPGDEYANLQASAIDLIHAKMYSDRWLGIKDPRFCRLLPFWLDVFSLVGVEVRFIHGIRNPLSVARSLQSRNDFELTKSLFLWLSHVVPPIVQTAGFRQTVLDFDSLMGSPNQEVERIASDLGFIDQLDAAALDRYTEQFLSPDLRHTYTDIKHLYDTENVPSLVADVYRDLLAIAQGKDTARSPQVIARFSEYRERLKKYEPLLALLSDREERNTALLEQAHQLEGLARNREIEIKELRLTVDERDKTIVERDLAVVERDTKLTEQHHHVSNLIQRINELDRDIEGLMGQLSAIYTSTSWRITRPMRAAIGLLKNDPTYRQQLRAKLVRVPSHFLASDHRLIRITRGLIRRDPAYWMQLRDTLGVLGRALPEITSPAPKAAQSKPLTQGDGVLHVAYISGESETPGHQYRVVRYADAAKASGAKVSIILLGELPERLHELETANIVIIWRAEWSKTVKDAIDLVKTRGAKLIFDVDDLMFVPELARTEIIDGIRSQGFAEDKIASFYSRIRETMRHADLCTVTTNELAVQASHLQLPVRVLPNGFDEQTFQVSRRAARTWAATRTDHFIRLGYAGGSRTHQRDFGLCADAVAAVLRSDPHSRLVLFRVKAHNTCLIDIEEFPALEGLEDRIEWRELVPLQRLPEEIARLDINLAPLEVGNAFCEAKSELKYFEAALAGVPTVASPTGPFQRCIKHGETGLIAGSAEEWTAALKRLTQEPETRARLAANALRNVLWRFGPERRVDQLTTLFELLQGGRRAAHAFAHDLASGSDAPPPQVPRHRVLFQTEKLEAADATVIVPVYNYANLLPEALNSVRDQSLEALDLIIIDDASTDDSIAVATQWASQHKERFNRLLILQNLRNSGLGPTRNLGFDAAETLYVMPLDPDNRLLPDCLERCVATMREQFPAFVYPVIRLFGDETGFIGTLPYDPHRFVHVNYIDAMALIAKSAWAKVGGYDHVRFGWEDYDFWCRLAKCGLLGIALGGKPAAEYRVHKASMLRTSTDIDENKRALIADMMRRHPWLLLPTPEGSITTAGPAVSVD